MKQEKKLCYKLDIIKWYNSCRIYIVLVFLTIVRSRSSPSQIRRMIDFSIGSVLYGYSLRHLTASHFYILSQVIHGIRIPLRVLMNSTMF